MLLICDDNLGAQVTGVSNPYLSRHPYPSPEVRVLAGMGMGREKKPGGYLGHTLATSPTGCVCVCILALLLFLP
jgi:hypothetical protein